MEELMSPSYLCFFFNIPNEKGFHIFCMKSTLPPQANFSTLSLNEASLKPNSHAS
jgi:hypothetical protein